MASLSSISGILSRMKDLCGTQIDKDLATLIGLSQQDFSNRKKRGTLIEPLVAWGINESVNINWLLTGEGNPHNTAEGIYKEDPETTELLEMTREVLQSDTSYSQSLKANIRSFHQAMIESARVLDLEARISQLEETTGKGQPHVGQDRRTMERRVNEGAGDNQGGKDRRSGNDRRVANLKK